jgi:hypothetical protein
MGPPRRWKLYEVGILPDGTLHNPRGYPDEIVRTAVLAADAHRRARRSRAAKNASETRARRHTNQIYAVTLHLQDGRSVGPRHHCAICGRGLGDPQSIERGIGSV